jgi:ribonuclease VapC
MIIDTSALVALLVSDPDAPGILRLMAGAPARRLSSASYVELAAVIDGRRDATLSGALDAKLRNLGIELVPFTVEQARIARIAYQQFGRGSGHPARLNMGDCFAYALARDLGEPLLFKGGDFALTDIELVVEPVRSRRLSEVVAAYAAGTAEAG